ncbi:MAG: cobalamin B12-binding domain-containing protein [Coriobacteriia bacterium]|nr:cobalamin B12-binding domain-containing protein [Coriobacteriia bacterium]
MSSGIDTSPADSVRAGLSERIAAHDKAGAVALALAAVADGTVDIPTLYADVLSRLMIDLGSQWQEGSLQVWEEHLASAVVRTIVEALYPTVRVIADATPGNGTHILLTCPPDEAHDLGLRMLADRLDMAGYTTFMLGPDTPGPEIVAAAQALAADLVVLTSSTHFHRLRVRNLVDQLHAQLPGVRVAVGGPAFAVDSEGFSPDEMLRLDELIAPSAKGGE